MAGRQRKQGIVAPAAGGSLSQDTTARTTVRKLQKPLMHYVPELSLPQMMRARHIERHSARIVPEQPEAARAFFSLMPPPAARTAAAAATAAAPSNKEEYRGLRSSTLAQRRRLHPRLRWPRLAKYDNDADASSAAPHQGCNLNEPSAELAASGDRRGELTSDILSSSSAGVRSTSKGRKGFDTSVTEDSEVDAQPCCPMILPRAPSRQPIAAGTISTLHAPSVVSSSLEQSLCEPPRPPSAAASEASFVSSCPSTSLRSHSSFRHGRASARGHVELSNIDRKWFMRVSPISCLPSEASAQLARQKLLRADDGKEANKSNPSPVAEPAEAEAAKAGEYVNFENWGLNDDYLDALLSAHCDSAAHGLKGVRHVNLSQNLLTRKGVEKLMEYGTPSSFISLNISSNRLQERGIVGTLDFVAACSHVQDLNLSGNALGDAVIERLCGLLSSHCLELKGLALAQCNIGSYARGGTALGGLVGAGRILSSLDLSWNTLHGEGAQSFIRGVYDNGIVSGGKLQRLDVAWNRMGSGSHSADETRRREALITARIWGEVFKHGNTLFHLDLSYNSFNVDECEAIAEGLQSNHTLFGIHLVGNEATVDDMGFVIPLRRTAARRDGSSHCPTDALNECLTASGDAEELAAVYRHDEEDMPPVGVDVDEGDTCQGALNSLLHSVPAKQRIDHAADFARAASLIAPGAAGPPPQALKINPSLRSLAEEHGTLMSFSEEDLITERGYVAQRSRVQAIMDPSKTASDAVQRNAKCCWMCENWFEHKIFFNPQKAGLGDEVGSIHAFYSIDGFVRPTKLTRQEHGRSSSLKHRSTTRATTRATRGASISQKRHASRSTHNNRAVSYMGCRMLPPTLAPLEVVFVVDGMVHVCRDMPRKHLHTPKTLPPCSSVQGLLHAKEIRQVNLVSVGSNNTTLGAASALVVLEDPAQRGLISVVPRRSWGGDLDLKKAEWCFETSLFKDYVRDEEAMIENCFDVDWRSGRLPQMLKTEDTRTEIYEYLKPLYLQVLLAFRVEGFSTLRSADDVAGINLLDFRNLMLRYGGEGRHKLMDGYHCKSSDCDCVFVAANVVDRNRRQDFTVMPHKALSRFQFLEAVVRMAFRRYLNLHGPPREASGAVHRQAVTTFMNNSLLGLDCLTLRQELHADLFTESSAQIVSQYSEILRSIFEHYRDLSKRPGVKRSKHLHWSAWQTLMQDAHIVDEKFGHRDIGTSFALAKELQADEANSTRHMELSWSEFLVALAAVVKLKTRLDIDIDEVEFAELLDEFFVEHMEDAYASLSTASHKRVHEHAATLEFLETVFSQADVKNKGLVSLRTLSQYFKHPEIKNDMARCKLTNSEIALLVKMLGESIANRGFDVLAGDNITLQEVCATMVQLKDALKGTERAIAYIEKSFDEFDDDGSGTLDIDEFQALISEPAMIRRLQSVGMGGDELEKIFDILDEDGIGSVSMDQVAEGFMCLRDTGFAAKRGVKLLYRHYCASGAASQGELNKEDLLATFAVPAMAEQLLAIRLKIPDWGTMFEELDVDGSGDLSWEEIGDGMLTFWQSTADVNH